MTSTESYTLVWLGIEDAVVSDHDKQAILEKRDPRVQLAQRHSFGWFCDSFSRNEETGEPVYRLLIGICIRMLGYKEGLTELRIDPEDLWRQTLQLRVRFNEAAISSPVRLFVLFHLEDEE